jgi:hypothetical protein
MSKKKNAIVVAIGFCLIASVGQAQGPFPCPGYNPANNTNLACQIVTVTQVAFNGTTTASLGSFAPTLATQLSQLPIATAISGSGLVFKGGIPTVSTESLGTILTQRGETLGKRRFFVAFNYQRFGFGSLDGVSLKNLPIANVTGGVPTEFTARIDLKVDQFTVLGSYGLTDRIDLSVIVPFSNVSLGTFRSDTPLLLAGSAIGLGDVTASVKVNVVRMERTSIAIGSEVRFPSGDATNYLGTGAYGVKPYFIFSHRGRITPNVNLGYLWNSTSILNLDINTGAHQSLPSSFLYSGGVDFLVHKHLTLDGEFLGQYVINGPRIALGPVQGASAGSFVTAQTGSYAMNNAGVGFKLNPYKGLLISANALFKLDDAGLRAKVVPLAGISYTF